jgi:hypothetical protein
MDREACGGDASGYRVLTRARKAGSSLRVLNIQPGSSL